MTDLTRRVLEAHTRYTAPDLHAEQADIDGPLLIDAAPVLARQVEALEALADLLDREAEKEREKPNRTPHDHGWDDACTVAASRIRAALNGDPQ